jgi:hypothetical protein
MQAVNPIVAADSLPSIPYVEARHYTRGRKRPRTLGAVIHCTDGAEGDKTAEDCAAMFHKGWDDPKLWRSATEVWDGNSGVRCVPLDCRAYHCGHNGNDSYLGLELCGRANQTREQWLDAKSLPMLRMAARRFAELCKEFDFPAVYADYTAVRAQTKGITTHLDISRAWGQTSHKDPGPGFPLADFIEAVRICRATL